MSYSLYAFSCYAMISRNELIAQYEGSLCTNSYVITSCFLEFPRATFLCTHRSSKCRCYLLIYLLTTE
jgi:hypothetical protein